MEYKKKTPAGAMPAEVNHKAADINYNIDAGFSPVEKMQWLASAASLQELSRTELAILIILADKINFKTGQAWPSYNTLAELTGTTSRNLKRYMSRLLKLNPPLVVMVEQGNRVKSNRYALNRAYFDQFNGLIGSDEKDTTVVTDSSSCSDVQGTDVVTDSSPESIYESEHKAKDEIERSRNDRATPARPERATGLPSVGKCYPEFFDIVGKRAVADSEQLIRELTNDGVDYQDIIEGAKRYRRYCIEMNQPMKTSPAFWLKSKKWLDDWEVQSVPKAKAPTKAVKAKPVRKAPPKQKPVKTQNREAQSMKAEVKNPRFQQFLTDVYHPFNKLMQSVDKDTAGKLSDYHKSMFENPLKPEQFLKSPDDELMPYNVNPDLISWIKSRAECLQRRSKFMMELNRWKLQTNTGQLDDVESERIGLALEAEAKEIDVIENTPIPEPFIKA